jgi:DMSO/TMAO reductase YedYZ molybdopterin-dependent catalytic subunit
VTLLPPGQRRIDDLPRFGTHLHTPPPPTPLHPTIRISGDLDEEFLVELRALDEVPRTSNTTDFHCVSGWSATGLRWGGVEFRTFYERFIQPRVPAGVTITHLVVAGLDGYEACLLLEDALEPDVILADGLNGARLSPAHGAPVRLVSPSQYGYMSVKHVRGIRLLTSQPALRRLGAATPLARLSLHGPLILRHPRARVWHEERHPFVPARVLRPVYRLFIKRGIALGAWTLREPPTLPSRPRGEPSSEPLGPI